MIGCEMKKFEEIENLITTTRTFVATGDPFPVQQKISKQIINYLPQKNPTSLTTHTQSHTTVMQIILHDHITDGSCVRCRQ